MPDDNFSVYTSKNGRPVDAWVKAIDRTGKIKPISVRTYQDTAYFYLPPGIYNLEVRPLEGTDIEMLEVAEVESFDDKVMHKTISFDSGKLRISTTNNGIDWDCMVKVINQKGKVIASTRTYNAPKEVEVDPGIYKVTIQALARMNGLNTYSEIENVHIKSADITLVSHNFRTGHFEVFTKVDGQNIDAVVNVKEVNSGKNVAGSRTYNKGAKFLLNPGRYSVKCTPLGNFKDRKAQTIIIEVGTEQTVSKTLNF